MGTLSMTRKTSNTLITASGMNTNMDEIEAELNSLDTENYAADSVTAAKLNSDVVRSGYGLIQHSDGSLYVDVSDTNPCLEITDGGVRVKVDGTTIERTASGIALVTNTVTDHGSLTGLTDDDHTQYHNTARHDADDHSSFSYATMGTGALPSSKGGTGYTSGTIARIKTGTYTGDGAATKAITGVGFQPKHLEIISNADTAPTMRFVKNDQMGTLAFGGDPNVFETKPDVIISLDADGFTVGDGTGANANWCNTNTKAYAYTAWG